MLGEMAGQLKPTTLDARTWAPFGKLIKDRGQVEKHN